MAKITQIYIHRDTISGDTVAHTTLSGLCDVHKYNVGTIRNALSGGGGIYFDRKRKAVISRAVLYKNSRIAGNIGNLS